MLGVPPVTDPRNAVKMAIVAVAKKESVTNHPALGSEELGYNVSPLLDGPYDPYIAAAVIAIILAIPILVVLRLDQPKKSVPPKDSI